MTAQIDMGDSFIFVLYEGRSKSNGKMSRGALFIIRNLSNLVTFEIRTSCTYTPAQEFLLPPKDLVTSPFVALP